MSENKPVLAACVAKLAIGREILSAQALQGARATMLPSLAMSRKVKKTPKMRSPSGHQKHYRRTMCRQARSTRGSPCMRRWIDAQVAANLPIQTPSQGYALTVEVLD